MSNPEMEKPTPEQAKRTEVMVAELRKAVMSVEAITDTIGELRRELNNARGLLGMLRTVIGPNAYPYRAEETWAQRIDKRIAEIEAALK
jgi:hypothetical protein